MYWLFELVNIIDLVKAIELVKKSKKTENATLKLNTCYSKQVLSENS